MTYGLSAEVLRKIRSTFAAIPDLNLVLLYGSRAMGREKPGSDIDLAIKNSALELAVLNDLRVKLDDLLLPYTFDIAIYEQIENSDLIDHIDRVGVQIFP